MRRLSELDAIRDGLNCCLDCLFVNALADESLLDRRRPVGLRADARNADSRGGNRADRAAPRL